MAEPKARWWESGRNLGFAGTVAAGLVLALIIYLVGLAPVLEWALLAWHWLIQPVGVPLALLVVMVLVIVLVALAAVQKMREPPPPAWLDYREDTFLGIVWRWSYSGNRLDERSIRAYCPQCGMALRGREGDYRGITTAFDCDDCPFRCKLPDNGHEIVDKVVRLIEREANRRARQPRP